MNFFKDKRFRITFFLFLVIAAVVITYVLTEKEKSDKQVVLPPKPIIQQYIESNFDISAKWSQTPQIPEFLPFYVLQNTALNQSQMDTIKKNLGFTESFSQISLDPNNIVSIVESDTAYLQIDPRAHRIEYKQYVDSESPLPTNTNIESAKQRALQFLVDKGFIPNKESMKIGTVQLLAIYDEGEVSTLPKNTVSISFSQNVDSYKVVGSSYDVGTAMVWFNAKGEVWRVYIDAIGSFEKGQDIPIKSIGELESTLRTSSLQSLGEISILELDPQDIENIEINEVEIVYLKEFNQAQSILQPIFNLTGTANLKNGRSVKAGLYLPAGKNQF